MSERLPVAVTPDEAMLLGPALNAGAEYQRASLRSSYRQELLLTEIRDLLAAQAPKAKPPKGVTPPPTE